MLSYSEHDIRPKLEMIGYTNSPKVVDAIAAVMLTLESLKLSPEEQALVLDLISKNGREALAKAPDWDEDSWVDFDYGNVSQGEFVRVKPDAYDSDSGARHNGLVGVMQFMKARVCTVDYIGLASGNSQKHPMEKLQSLKGVYNRRPSQNT
jgi:hypothetical protein